MIPSGCQYELFMREPIVFVEHGHDCKTVLGVCKNIKITKTAVLATTEILVNDDILAGWAGAYAVNLLKRGLLPGWSIGFSIFGMEARQATKQDESIYGKCKFIVTKWQLLEYSFVAMPANLYTRRTGKLYADQHGTSSTTRPIENGK